jgi:hypothetical protein
MAASSAKSMRIEVQATTSASPQQVIEMAGKDFSPRRAEIWPNVTTKRYTVHDQGETYADVTEGGTGPAFRIWERSRYDWSQPGLVTSTVSESNALLPGTTFELRASPRDEGSTVEMILDRRFRPDQWGRFAYAVNRIVGRRGFGYMLRQTLKAVEKRQGESSQQRA